MLFHHLGVILSEFIYSRDDVVGIIDGIVAVLVNVLDKTVVFVGGIFAFFHGQEARCAIVDRDVFGADVGQLECERTICIIVLIVGCAREQHAQAGICPDEGRLRGFLFFVDRLVYHRVLRCIVEFTCAEQGQRREGRYGE